MKKKRINDAVISTLLMFLNYLLDLHICICIELDICLHVHIHIYTIYKLLFN